MFCIDVFDIQNYIFTIEFLIRNIQTKGLC